MRTTPKSILACACLWFATAAQAHEFWMLPDRFSVATGGIVGLSLGVGENFEGEPMAFARSLVASLRHHRSGLSAELADRVPDSPQPRMGVQLQQPGTHLLAMDTNPATNLLDAAKFNDYLQEDGLWRVAEARQRAGTAEAAGRERFRRNIKTLVRVGGRSDATFAHRTGQRLEIVPLADPFRQPPRQALGFQVFYEGRPLAAALLKLWHREGSQRLVFQALTDEQGIVSVALRRPGTWMASVVHMVPVAGTPDLDWESFWANLTFELAPPR